MKLSKVVVKEHNVLAEAGTSLSKGDIIGGSVEVERNKLVSFEGGIYLSIIFWYKISL